MIANQTVMKSWWNLTVTSSDDEVSLYLIPVAVIPLFFGNDGQISVFPVISVITMPFRSENLFRSLSWRYGRTSVVCEVLLRTHYKQIICSRIGFIIFDGSALFPSRWTLIHSNDNPYPFDIFFFFKLYVLLLSILFNQWFPTLQSRRSPLLL